jgi:hypothetical protein
MEADRPTHHKPAALTVARDLLFMLEQTAAISQERRIELKYMLDDQLALQVKQWAREHLGFDPHCTDEAGEHYDVDTLYLDTAQLDLYNRSGAAGRAKHRVRCYGNQPLIWLETKRKIKSTVYKNRTAIPHAELHTLATAVEGSSAVQGWCGRWFLDRINRRDLQPAVQVAYCRFVRAAVIDGRHLRLTIDSGLSAQRANGWAPATVDQGIRINAPQVLELKFYNRMPHLFKELLRTFTIPASGFSKYRTAVEACGLVASADRSPVAASDQGSRQVGQQHVDVTECFPCA